MKSEKSFSFVVYDIFFIVLIFLTDLIMFIIPIVFIKDGYVFLGIFFGILIVYMNLSINIIYYQLLTECE